MSDSLNYLLTGFFGQSAEILGERRQLADEYFADKYEMARNYATKTRATIQTQANARKTDVGRLKALKVPPSVINRAMGDDPDLVTELANNLEKLAAKGIDVTDPQVYSGLEQAAKDAGVSTSQLIKESGDDIANNAAADPYSFRADPLGAIAATLSGFKLSPYEKANARLDKEMIDGKSASEWLAQGEVPASDSNEVPVGINWSSVGEDLRSLEGTTQDITVAQRASIPDKFNEWKADAFEALKKEAGAGGVNAESRAAMEQEAERQAREMLDNTYGADVVSSILGDAGYETEAIPTITTKEERDALPVGTEYRGPDGVVRRKQ